MRTYRDMYIYAISLWRHSHQVTGLVFSLAFDSFYLIFGICCVHALFVCVDVCDEWSVHFRRGWGENFLCMISIVVMLSLIADVIIFLKFPFFPPEMAFSTLKSHHRDKKAHFFFVQHSIIALESDIIYCSKWNAILLRVFSIDIFSLLWKSFFHLFSHQIAHTSSAQLILMKVLQPVPIKV